VAAETIFQRSLFSTDFLQETITRTADGRSRAKARGQHMGRKSKLTLKQQAEARQRRAEGATLKELAQSYNVGIAMISRLKELPKDPD
jgi:DNA invertase Pin-like site-specific DNA recombinase